MTPLALRLRAATTPPVQAAIDQVMAANHLDAIIALTNGPAWPTNDNPNEGDLNGHFEYFVGSSTAAAVSGYPDITVPAGYDAGLPLGITFIGGRWAEPKLLGLAYDYEQATHVRVPPQFIPTIGDALFPGVPNPPTRCGRSGSRRPRVSAISSCACGKEHRGDNEARPFGRASYHPTRAGRGFLAAETFRRITQWFLPLGRS